MLDRRGEPRASTVKGLRWQTVLSAHIEHKGLSRTLANPLGERPPDAERTQDCLADSTRWSAECPPNGFTPRSPRQAHHCEPNLAARDTAGLTNALPLPAPGAAS
jgi:hypothetical protein